MVSFLQLVERASHIGSMINIFFFAGEVFRGYSGEHQHLYSLARKKRGISYQVTCLPFPVTVLNTVVELLQLEQTVIEVFLTPRSQGLFLKSLISSTVIETGEPISSQCNGRNSNSQTLNLVYTAAKLILRNWFEADRQCLSVNMKKQF